MSTAVRLPSPINLAAMWPVIRELILALTTSRAHRITVCLLLVTQAGLLGYSATRHSPTHLEPAFLVSGISHWQFGRFELYRVNPPLVRMIAALPVLAVGCETDWSRFYDAPGSRAEFPIGADFIKANGPNSIPLFFYARWACIPFNLIGAYFAYRWATELYQSIVAGLATLILYVFEPNLLAHGELITPDGACTAFGIMAGYAFWRWLKQPAWTRALLAGGALGLAELSKMSWLILVGLWPLLWLMWRWIEPCRYESQAREGKSQGSMDLLDTEYVASKVCFTETSTLTSKPSFPQLAAILALSIYSINVGYGFDGFCARLNDFQFVSTTLAGRHRAGESDNRFRGSCLAGLPVPLPKQYLLGLDSEMKDLESFGQKSYLRGEWKDGGWWYYYLYGLLIKVPCGTWGVLAVVLLIRFFNRPRLSLVRDEAVLLAPAATLLVAVSSQLEFNIHLRYAFPSLGLILVFLGQSGLCFLRRSSATILLCGLLGYSVVSALIVYPHHLAYFNDFVGGPKNGHKHLLGSSFDWGQDFILLTEMIKKKPSAKYFCAMPAGYHVADILPLDIASRVVGCKDLSTAGPNLKCVVSMQLIMGSQLHSPGLLTIKRCFTPRKLNPHKAEGSVGYTLLFFDADDSVHAALVGTL